MNANEVIEAALLCPTMDGPHRSHFVAEIDGVPRTVTYYTLVNGHEHEPGADYPRPLPASQAEAIALLCGKLLAEAEDHQGSILVWRIRPYTEKRHEADGWVARCRLAFLPSGAKIRIEAGPEFAAYGTPGL